MRKALEGLASTRRIGQVGRVVAGFLSRPAVGERLEGCVADVMTREVATCLAEEPLSRAAQSMWDRDCGLVVVLRADKSPIGVVTDRDLCMASLTQGRALADITAGSVLSEALYTCTPGESLVRASELMQRHRVRRLVVRDGSGHLVGVLSFADLARRVMDQPEDSISARLFLATLAGSLAAPWRASAKSAPSERRRGVA